MEMVLMLYLGFVIFSIFINIISSNEVIDLTWDFGNRTVYWPGQKKFDFTKVYEGTDKGFWYSVKEFCTAEHGGTHFDAPYHFYEDGWKVGDVPVGRLIAKGVLVDLTDKTESLGANATLEVDDLEEWQRINGPFENGSILLVKFGWSKYWDNIEKYLGEKNGKMQFPGISRGAAEWLASGKFFGVGLDTASGDPGSSTDFIVHKTLSKHQMYILENVKITQKLPAKGFTLVVMPMKLQEGSGAPLRLVAITSNNNECIDK